MGDSMGDGARALHAVLENDDSAAVGILATFGAYSLSTDAERREERRSPMFRTEGEKVARGNYDVQASCPKGHTCYKKRGDSNPYKCPYCGHEVP